MSFFVSKIIVMHGFNIIFNFFRETLIGQLYEYIKGLKSDFQSKSTFSKGEGPPKGHNMPEIINYVMWGRQLEARVCFQFFCCKLIRE